MRRFLNRWLNRVQQEQLTKNHVQSDNQVSLICLLSSFSFSSTAHLKSCYLSLFVNELSPPLFFFPKWKNVCCFQFPFFWLLVFSLMLSFAIIFKSNFDCYTPTSSFPLHKSWCSWFGYTNKLATFCAL